MAISRSTPVGSARIGFKLDSPGEEYWPDITSIVIENEESQSDVVTYWDVANEGEGRQFFFTISAIQSTDPDSFWSFVWDNTGEVISYTYAPFGNEEPAAGKPHFIGTCKVGPKPSIGGEAQRGGATFTFDTRFDIITGPTLDRGND